MYLVSLILHVLGHLSEEQTVFEFFLSVLDHLREAMRYCVADAFQELALLRAQDGHGVLVERDQHSLVTESLVLQIFQVGVPIQL